MTYQLTPLSDAMRTQSDALGEQRAPAMAALSDGGAIVTWANQRFNPDELLIYDIVAQRYDASGNPVGDMATIYAGPDDTSDIAPMVAGLTGGGYAIAFRDDATRDMRVKVFDAAGAEVADHLIDLPNRWINEGTRSVEVTAHSSGYGNSTITALDNGGFAVTFTAGYPGILAQYGGGATSYTATFDDSGAQVRNPLHVSSWMGTGSYSQDHQNHVYDSLGLDDGKYVIATRIGESTNGNDSGYPSVALQVRDATGSLVTSAYLASPTPDQPMSQPSLARLADGSFVAAWTMDDDTVWRRFDADGVPISGQMGLGNTFYAAPNVSALADGGFLIANLRISGFNPSFSGWAHRFDADGNQVGDPIQIHTRGDDEINYLQSAHDFVTLGDGTVLAMWSGEASWNGNGRDVLIQRFMGEAIGTEGNDTLAADGGVTAVFGLAGDDVLNGSVMADALDGGDGHDTIRAGAGDDTVDGGTGNDDIGGEAGDDLLTGGAGNDTVEAGDGNDSVDGGDGDDDIDGGAGDDALTGGTGNDTVAGGDGNDTLDGGDGDDDLRGGAGDDSLTASDGIDTLWGGDGNDTLDGGDDDDELRGEAGDDSLLAGNGNDLLEGGDGNDTLDGGYGEDTLAGGAGDDLLTGAGSADLFVFGAGNDTVADFRPGTDRFEFAEGTDLAGATSADVDGNRILTLADGSSVTLLGVTSNSAARGAPVVAGTAEEGQTLTADASAVSDRDGIFAGTEGYQWLRDGAAIAGATTAGYMLTADDVGAEISVAFSYIDGGANRETVASAATGPVAEGPKTLIGTPGDDVLIGGTSHDRLEGLDGNDRLIGNAGDDTMLGGDGTDTINGGDGDDLIRGGDTEADRRDVVYAGGGNDSVDGGHGNDHLFGMDGDDTLAGGFGADTVEGQSGNDVITGSAFSDVIWGGAGDDFVNGGFGHDLIVGDTGADKFFHVGGPRDQMEGHGSDWIMDYTAADGDVLLFGDATARADQFQVNTTHTVNSAGERSGDDDIEEAFVIYRPTGQILWALVDGAGQGEINLQIGAEVFDLLG